MRGGARRVRWGTASPPQPGLYLAAGHTRRRRATSQAARDERASAAGIAAEARTRVAVGGGVSTLASAPTPGRGRRERCRATHAAARKKANPCTLPSNAKVDVVFYGLADGDQDLYIDVRVACAESHEVGFKEAIAAAEKIKTDKYAREVAGISQSAFLPFVVG